MSPLIAPNSGRPTSALYLQFWVGEYACGLPGRWVEQVIPAVELTTVPDTPRHLKGLLRYRGGIVPVIDLCQLLLQRAATVKLSTRIILLRRAPELPGVVLGVLAEQVLSVVEIPEAACRSAGVPLSAESLMSGVVAETALGWIHLLEPVRLIPLGLAESDSNPPSANVLTPG